MGLFEELGLDYQKTEVTEVTESGIRRRWGDTEYQEDYQEVIRKITRTAA